MMDSMRGGGSVGKVFSIPVREDGADLSRDSRGRAESAREDILYTEPLV